MHGKSTIKDIRLVHHDKSGFSFRWTLKERKTFNDLEAVTTAWQVRMPHTTGIPNLCHHQQKMRHRGVVALSWNCTLPYTLIPPPTYHTKHRQPNNRFPTQISKSPRQEVLNESRWTHTQQPKHQEKNANITKANLFKYVGPKFPLLQELKKQNKTKQKKTQKELLDLCRLAGHPFKSLHSSNSQLLLYCDTHYYVFTVLHF